MGFVITDTEFVGNHACASVYQFLVSKLHLYHTITLYTPHANHQGSRNHIQNHLLGSTALHTTGTSYKLWADNRLYGILSGSSQRRMRIAGNTTCKQTLLASSLDGTNHVRCGTRGSDTYHRIIGGRLIAHQVVPTLLLIVLGTLYSAS